MACTQWHSLRMVCALLIPHATCHVHACMYGQHMLTHRAWYACSGLRSCASMPWRTSASAGASSAGSSAILHACMHGQRHEHAVWLHLQGLPARQEGYHHSRVQCTSKFGSAPLSTNYSRAFSFGVLFESLTSLLPAGASAAVPPRHPPNRCWRPAPCCGCMHPHAVAPLHGCRQAGRRAPADTVKVGEFDVTILRHSSLITQQRVCLEYLLSMP